MSESATLDIIAIIGIEQALIAAPSFQETAQLVYNIRNQAIVSAINAVVERYVITPFSKFYVRDDLRKSTLNYALSACYKGIDLKYHRFVPLEEIKKYIDDKIFAIEEETEMAEYIVMCEELQTCRETARKVAYEEFTKLLKTKKEDEITKDLYTEVYCKAADAGKKYILEHAPRFVNVGNFDSAVSSAFSQATHDSKK